LKYTNHTEKGSSGSPVFNNSWELIGIHIGGGDKDVDGKFLNNHGTRMDDIVNFIKVKSEELTKILQLK